MNYKFKKVAVLGSGVMGSGIACHLANIGMKVILLDLTYKPKDSKEKKYDRNKIVNDSLLRIVKSKPSPLYDKNFVNRIETGNFDDDIARISKVDWIIEVIIENVEIKKDLLEKIEKYRDENSIVSSNTSSIPINTLAEGRSDNFKSHFCGVHFFNPPRYLRLIEIIPNKLTSKSVIEYLINFSETYLGKEPVYCKDTPAFIANRLGVMSNLKLIQLTDRFQYSIEEIDLMTGSIIARPNTATFRLQDLVGIDTGEKVSNFVRSNVKNDDFIDSFKDIKTPKYINFLLKNNFLGNKTNKGFYEKTAKKDHQGKTIIKALDLDNLEYKLTKKPHLPLIKKAKQIENFSKRLTFLLNGEDKENLFYKEYFSSLFEYSANRIPEIADQFIFVDKAMKSGFNWDFGPFEYWDLIGFQNGINIIKSFGGAIPAWIKQMSDRKIDSFYKIQDGKKKFLDIKNFKYSELPGANKHIVLKYQANNIVLRNSECNVIDIGDGVLCVEFNSKSNSISENIGKAISDSIDLAVKDGWRGIVIGNNAKQFSVGANLMNLGMLAMQKKFDELNILIQEFQNLVMKIKTSKIPIVVSTQGYVFGGACEISMHCDAGIYAAESYIGLVEVGVGLLPAGGGVKELAIRASDKFYEGDVKMPVLIDHFKSIATASVSTSAWEGYNLNYLTTEKDFVCVNLNRNIFEAKKKVLQLSENYMPPNQKIDIQVLGRAGISTLYSAINEYKLAGYMSDYDVVIARKIANVICGGDLTSDELVSEKYLLNLEREAFLSLLGNQKTIDRIQYLLLNNKPLRN